MAVQRGIVVYDRWRDAGVRRRALKRWYIRVWDTRQRRYHGRSFAEHDLGIAWAEATRARYLLEQESAMPVRLAQLTDDYTQELSERGRNPDYIAEIRRVSAAISAAGADNLKTADVAGIVRRWLTTLKANWYAGASANPYRRTHHLELSPVTKNRFLQHLRSLMRHAVLRGILPRDPLLGLRRFSEDRPLKPTFSIDELRTLLHHSHEDDPYFLVFAMLIYTGCRMAEATHLRWENLDITGKRLAVKLSPAYALKRRKERTVFLQPELISLLLPRKKPDGYIIPDDRWRTRNRKHLSMAFTYYLKRCGLPPSGRSPHSARHTWVSLLLASGENVFTVAGEAGHESLLTTQGYARTQGAYREGVKGWELGVFTLRSESPGP